MSHAVKKDLSTPSVTELASQAIAPRNLRDVSLNRRVLVVEDEAEIAKSYVDLLSAKAEPRAHLRSSRSIPNVSSPVTSPVFEGYEVTVVHSAEQAMAAVATSLESERPFAMAFVDVLLGEGMDGIELVKNLFGVENQLRVVFVTAYQDRSVNAINDLLGRQNATRWDYLNKPFSDGEIIQKARNGVAMWNLKFERDAKASELNEARSRLLTSERLVSVATVARGVGHEFGNILLHVLGRAELSRSGDPEEMRKGFDVIIKACETASGILEKFNQLAQPQAELKEKITIAVYAPLDEAVELMAHELYSCELAIDRSAVEGLTLQAAKGSLVQVFVNLLMNAVDAMGENGRIEIAAVRDDEWIEYRVRDHGPGIPEHIIDHVTEAFFTTKGEQGTGLGLAICREIVEIEHAGEFVVKNHPEGGAEFVIRLPLSNAWEVARET